jgi:hypothetical protein
MIRPARRGIMRRAAHEVACSIHASSTNISIQNSK